METNIIDSNVKKSRLVLKWTFTLLPIIAGLDKFLDILVEWERYLNPITASIISPPVFMRIVGVIEIIVGIIVYLRPKIGSLIVMIWLVLIAINLVITGYYDIAVRDIVMAISASILFRLTPSYSEKF